LILFIKFCAKNLTLVFEFLKKEEISEETQRTQNVAQEDELSIPIRDRLFNMVRNRLMNKLMNLQFGFFDNNNNNK
jgi:hypothetical protein